MDDEAKATIAKFRAEMKLLGVDLSHLSDDEVIAFAAQMRKRIIEFGQEIGRMASDAMARLENFAKVLFEK